MGSSRLSKATLAIYTRQKAIMLRSGVALLEAAGSLTRGEHEGLNRAYDDVARRLQSGSTLSGALARHPDLFPTYYTGLVKVAEQSGTLVGILDRLADYLEKRARLERQLGAALAYPVVLSLVSLALLTLLTVYILPMMEPLFAQVGGELPWLTRLLLAASHGFWRVETWGAVGLALLIAGIAGRQVLEAETDSPLRRFRDRTALELPLLGKLTRWATVAQLLRLFSLMVEAGVDVRQILRTLRATLTNQDFQDALTLMEEGLKEGQSIAQAMDRSPVFPSGCISMVAIAEESGQLASTLERIADLYDDQVETLTANAVALLEPLLLCCSSLFVGIVCLATLLPWLQLVTQLSS